MQTLLNPRFRLAAFIVWCICWPAVAALLLTPLPFDLISRSDLLGHLLLFAVMTSTIVAFARSRTQIVILSLVTVAYGIALEFGQAYVPGRTFDAADAIANALGGAVGCLAALVLLERLVGSRSRKRPDASSARPSPSA